MKAKILLLIIILIIPKFYRAQARNTSNGKQLLYNVSIGAVVGAAGAVINKNLSNALPKY